MQDEIREKSVAFVVKCEKMTIDLLKWTIQNYLRQLEKQKSNTKVPHGKQSVKQLVGQGAGVANIEITEKNIKGFEGVARKYGIDFALKKDSTTSPPKYLVFFKSRDADALKTAFQEFTVKTVKKQERTKSILKQLSKMKVTAMNLSDKAKHKHKEIGR